MVAYAREMRKPLALIDAATLTTGQENFEHFAKRNRNLDNLNSLPDAPAAADSEPGADPSPAPRPVTVFQRKVDYAAVRGAPQYRRLTSAVILLHLLATLIAAAGLAFGWQLVSIPWLKLFCLLGALGLALVLRQTGAHHHWVRSRLAAEIGSSALAAWGLPRAAPVIADLDFADFRQRTRSLHILRQRLAAAAPVSIAAFRQRCLAQRLEDQLAYCRRHLARAEPLLRRLRLGFWISTVLAVLCTSACALRLGELAHGTVAEELLYYFPPISLPVIAAAFLSMVSVYDLQRRMARYRETEHLLVSSRSQIAFSQTWTSLERIVEKTERALLQEGLEWHAMTSFSESH